MEHVKSGMGKMTTIKTILSGPEYAELTVELFKKIGPLEKQNKVDVYAFMIYLMTVYFWAQYKDDLMQASPLKPIDETLKTLNNDLDTFLVAIRTSLMLTWQNNQPDRKGVH